MAMRTVLAFSGVLFLVSLGALLLPIPILSIAAWVWDLLGRIILLTD